MSRGLFFFLCTTLFYYSAFSQKNVKSKSKYIIIQGQIPPGYQKSEIALLFYAPFSIRVGYIADDKKNVIENVKNGFAKWKFETVEPTFVTGDFIKNKYFEAATLEPGDSINIVHNADNIVFSGKGYKKLELQREIWRLSDSIDKLDVYKNISHRIASPSSITDYLLWMELLNKKEELIIPLIESYRSGLSDFAYNDIKEQFLYRMEENRVSKFSGLRGKAQTESNTSGDIVNQFGLTDKDLCEICDSTLNGIGAHWLQYEASIVNDPYYLMFKLALDLHRSYGKFIKGVHSNADSSLNGINFWIRLYNIGKQKYSGIIREAILSYVLWYPRGMIYNYGFTNEVEKILADYYAISQFPRYKEFTKKYEDERRDSYNAKIAPGFSLTDTKGMAFSSDKMKGKIAILDFWFTGCSGCVQMAAGLRNVENFFKDDTNVVFLNISIDKNKDKWIKSIAEAKYTSGSGINLYTNGNGSSHPVTKKYGVDAYPTLYLIDPINRVLRPSPKPDPRKDNGKALIELVQKELAYMKDGPYVFHAKDSVVLYSISSNKVTKTPFLKTTHPLLPVQTDIYGKHFNVSLKKSLLVEPCEFSRPNKLLVLSDIEGNLEAFRRLLQSNKVIDQDYNWIFNDGHLVFAGDMFDRGQQVTECLWLVYSLEEKAKKVGGYVHFILGNHEILNLRGYNVYTQKKYYNNAVLMNKTLTQLYTEDNELGKWLRTKNIIERIGDLLFLHGGISPKLNEIQLTINEINQIARPYYALHKKDYGDERLNTIMSDNIGPYWFRGYYQGNTPETVIDSTLKNFNVNRIITGHTIVADTISVHYGGKVINTDIMHAEGKSEALLIDGEIYYRVNQQGERKLLSFINDQKSSYISIK